MATQAIGASSSAAGPCVRAQRATIQPNTDGKRARARQSSTITATPTGRDSPPYCTTTIEVQYTMPSEERAPVT